MKWCSLILLWATCSAMSEIKLPVPPAAVVSPPAAAVLRWQNSETIEGELIEASGDDLTWKTNLFEDPLVLRWNAVRRIDRRLPSTAPTDPFSIASRDGSHLYGTILSIDGTTVTIRSARHGDAVLKRSELLNARRVRSGSQLVYSGPTGDVGWEAVGEAKRVTAKRSNTEPARELPSLTSGPGGALLMPYWNRGAFLELPLPDRIEAEFRLHSTARLEFEFALGTGNERLRLETWDDELVFVAWDQFKMIRKIAPDERSIALRLCWDRAGRKCALYNEAGESLGDWEIPEHFETINKGVVVHGKGRDLSLDLLRIRAWDGKPPQRIGTQTRVELADGHALIGEISGAGEDKVTVRSRADNTLADVALRDVEALIFSTDAPVAKARPVALAFSDATALAGELVSIKDGRALLKVAFAEAPFAVAMEGLRQLALQPSDEIPDVKPVAAGGTLDELVLQQNTLHGSFVGTGDDSPKWLPVGGVRPSMPSKILMTEIRRALPPTLEFPAPPALFYTSSGDVLPGELRTIDAKGIEIHSNVTEMTKLAAEEIDAIQFGAVAQLHMRGFVDPGWHILKGDESTVRKTESGIDMEPSTAIGHSAVMQSSEIRFNLISNPLSTLRLRLFCAGTDPTKSTSLILAHWGTRIYYGLESSEGQLQNQFQSNITSGQPLAVTLLVHERQIELQLNAGMITQRFAIDPAKRAGSGMVIEPASIWGNTPMAVSISDFATRSLPGRTWLPDVNAEAKVQTLTIPRFRKDAPPRHALLAANGDVLRGEIEAATANHFGFRSGLETLRIPRDRVKAAIWLKTPLADAAAPLEKNPSRARLDQMIERYTSFSGVGLNSLIAFLQQQAPDLKFKLPEKTDDRRFAMRFGGQTIGAALEQICSQFGLRYRSDSDGTIVLEPMPQMASDFFQKVYWLKTAAFTNAAAAQKVFSEKGIPFPKGASVDWQPRARQLIVTNTLANHTALAQLLETELGGVTGSPTHWLLLTSGARLGLTVEKFDRDVIVGHHPLFGRCQVPISDVFVVRTSIPEPTAAMRSLADWHLAFAPEPVLPETGGESSPMLGKAAPPFKLPLLGGGEFELAKENGKIVVLDFWATWCGPCIKSLPAIIAATSEFPGDRVRLIGVNQSEPPAQVQRFLDAHNWKFTVALDAAQSVARQYNVDGIPHTVVVGADGKVAWVKTGYSPEGGKELGDAIKQLLAQNSSSSPGPAAESSPETSKPTVP